MAENELLVNFNFADSFSPLHVTAKKHFVPLVARVTTLPVLAIICRAFPLSL